LEEIRRRQAARQEASREAQREMRRPREEPGPPAPPREVKGPSPEVPPGPVGLAELPVVVATAAVPGPPPEEAVVAAVPAVAPLPPVTVPVSSAGRAAAQAHAQLLGLLKSPQGLRAAFLLREVLDVPLCKRRRG